jgi:DNA-binding response OmpR family regulator
VDKDQHNSYRGYAAGGADYISKPFDPWVLRAKVQVFVDLWAAGRRLATQAAFLRGQIDDSAGPLDVLRALQDRLAGVEEAVEQLAADTREVDDAAVAAAVDRVTARLTALREALEAFDEVPDIAGITRREFG